MGGAPITVVCYRDAVFSYATKITTPAILQRIKEIVEESGQQELEDIIYYEREPWTKTITSDWPAVDSFQVRLLLDQDAPKR